MQYLRLKVAAQSQQVPRGEPLFGPSRSRIQSDFDKEAQRFLAGAGSDKPFQLMRFAGYTDPGAAGKGRFREYHSAPFSDLLQIAGQGKRLAAFARATQ